MWSFFPPLSFVLTSDVAESSSPPRNHLNLGAGLAAAATHSTSTTVFVFFAHFDFICAWFEVFADFKLDSRWWNGNSDVHLTCCWYSIATSVNGSYLAFPFSVILVYCLVDRDSTLPISITML